MGAIIMDGAVINSNTIIAAGAVVKEGTVVDSGSVWAGIPARKVKDIDEALLEGTGQTDLLKLPDVCRLV